MKRREDKTSQGQNEERRKRPWLRRVGVVVGCLLAGAIINVLVAWGVAYLSVDWELQGSHFLSRDASEEEAAWLFEVFQPSYVVHKWTAGDRNAFGIDRKQYFPYPEHFDLGGSFSAAVGMTRTGWPAYSLWSFDLDNVDPRASDREYRGAIILDREIPPELGVVGVFKYPIPLTPCWPGFLINTVFYGVIAWMLFAAPCAVRRNRRVKKYRCPDCGYDLRGADHGKCPECGEAVAGKRQQPNSRTAKQVAD